MLYQDLYERMPRGKSGRKRRFLWLVLAVFVQKGFNPNKSYGVQLAMVNRAFSAKLFIRAGKAESPVANLQMNPQISLRWQIS